MTDDSDSLNMMSALGPEQINAVPPVTFLGEASIEPAAPVGVIEAALTQVRNNLTDFAASSTFETDLLTVFGESADVELGRTIIDALAVGEELPQIVVAPVELMNGAAGGFDSVTGTVYLADSLIDEGSEPVTAVLTEELAHYIDSQLNPTDTPGDEGKHFATLLGGEVLNEVDVGRLRREDDRVRIFGGLVEVEASGEISFANSLNFSAGKDPVSVAVGEFNDDGNLDLAVANRVGQVSILLGNGNGTFGNATSFAVAADPTYVAIADFNNDDISDLAVASLGGNLSILLGKGDGSFGNATNFEVDRDSVWVAVGEFNGDGNSDLAIANSRADSVSILFGDGAGNFQNSTNLFAGERPISVVIGNFDGNKHSDLVVANAGSQDLSIFLGDGKGNFINSANLTTEDDPGAVAVGEFNGDGNSDLVGVEEFGGFFVWLGDGKGGFSDQYLRHFIL